MDYGQDVEAGVVRDVEALGARGGVRRVLECHRFGVVGCYVVVGDDCGAHFGVGSFWDFVVRLVCEMEYVSASGSVEFTVCWS